ncbi:MAG TPA: alkylmercury lyase family protein [Steroidobacteraceae bacterium]|nr:alkylmercury lyase family protein [Steroidobacteraceae bacterium]
MTIEIRPGVERPDWSVVTSAAARQALLARDRRRLGSIETWPVGLTASQDLVWRTTLELFARLGRPPQTVEIALEAKLAEAAVRQLVCELRSHDLLGLDDNAAAIGYIYPLTARRTEHRITLNRHALHALCAVDALGVGAMYRADVVIESSCRSCGADITVRTAQDGTALAAAQPAGVMVWYDLAYDRSAAASCCPSIAFFCGAQHLRQWRDAQGAKRVGTPLTLDEAFEVGRALFGPVLRMSTEAYAAKGGRDRQI